MKNDELQNLVKQALMLDTAHRTQFLDNITDKDIKNKLEFILADETRITDFVLNTSAGSEVLHAPENMEFSVGDKIRQFTIIKMLAKGGMGCVYLAYDEKLNRNVALKTMRNEFLKSKSTQLRFQQEAQILSKINHPSICQIFDIIDEEQSDILVLELIEGETLNQIVDKSENQLDIFIQIASALQAAHSQGIIHRDLKPDNIMLTRDGLVKVLDFGIAKSEIITTPEMINKTSTDSENVLQTQAGSMMGTLIYMSPEQASGKKVTTASDIYSFGIIMQELLTGLNTYVLDDTENLKRQIIDARKINTINIPKSYQSLIAEMTSIKPEERPDAEEVSRKLKKIKHKQSSKKTKIIVSTATFVIIALVAFLIWKQVENQKITKKNDFIAEIQNETDELKVGLRNIYALPLHDSSKNKEKIKIQKLHLQEKIIDSNALNNAEKDMYLGMLLIATDNHADGLAYLQKAWDAGLNSEDLAYSLAHTNSLVYYDELNDFLSKNGYVIRRDNKKIQELEKQYLQPAVTYYQLASQTHQETPNITKALILWSENKTEEAIQILDKIITEKDWLFEAYMLKASFLYTIGQTHIYEGRYDIANDYRIQSLSAFKDAQIRGRSYAPAYTGYCSMQVILLLDKVQRTGGDVSDNYNEASKSCNEALVVSDLKSTIYTRLAKLNYYYFVDQMNKGIRNGDLLLKALMFNQKAIDLEPSFINYNNRAEIYNFSAKAKINWGGDPESEIENSIKASEQTLKLSDYNNVFVYNTLVTSLDIRMRHQLNIGVDTTDSFNSAVEYYDKALSLDDTNDYSKLYLMVNNSNLYNNQIRNQILRNLDFQSLFETVVEILFEIQKINENEPISRAVLAESYLLMAQNTEAEDSLKYINLSLKSVNKANELMKDIGDFVALEGYIRGYKEVIKEKVLNESPDFTLSIEMFERGVELDPSAIDIYSDYAEICLLAAQASGNKNNTKKLLLKGLKMADKAVEINTDYSYGYLQKTKIIDFALRKKVDIPFTQKDADEAFEKAKSINPLLKRN